MQVNDLRQGMAGALYDDQLQKLVGDRIERYRNLGNTSVQFGTSEWRDLAMTMCFSEDEALERVGAHAPTGFDSRSLLRVFRVLWDIEVKNYHRIEKRVTCIFQKEP